jgi:hypothetical protein
MRNETRWMESEAMEWVERSATVLAKGDYLISLKDFGELAPALQNRVIRRIIGQIQGGLRRIHLRHIEAVRNLIQGRPQKRLNLPNGIVVIRTYDTHSVHCTMAKNRNIKPFTLL